MFDGLAFNRSTCSPSWKRWENSILTVLNNPLDSGWRSSLNLPNPSSNLPNWINGAIGRKRRISIFHSRKLHFGPNSARNLIINWNPPSSQTKKARNQQPESEKRRSKFEQANLSNELTIAKIVLQFDISFKGAESAHQKIPFKRVLRYLELGYHGFPDPKTSRMQT